MRTLSVVSVDSTESDKSLRHELDLIYRSSLLRVSSWMCSIISISYARGCGFKTHFLQNILSMNSLKVI